MAGQSICYEPLDKAAGEIRLIEIQDSTSDSGDLVSLRLFKWAPDKIDFVALSYVWGDPSITQDVLVDGIKVPVTTNLASALWHLRESGLDKADGVRLPVWVDAICINQKDVQERGHQVKLMRSIYRQARAVLSWLGPPDGALIDLALGVIRVMARQGVMTGELGLDILPGALKWILGQEKLCRIDTHEGLENRLWNAIYALATSEYWERIWIIQEVTLAKSDPPQSHIVFCGEKWVTYADLEQFAAICNHLVTQKPNLQKAMNNEMWLQILNTTELHFLPLSNIRELKQSYGLTMTSISKAAQMCTASDPRDMVYGLLGIIPNELEPDYSKSVREVYLDWYRALIDQTGRCVLELAGVGAARFRNEYDLPSWMPHLHELSDHEHTLIMKEGQTTVLRMVMTSAHRPSIRADGVLCCYGLVSDCVARVAPVGFSGEDGDGDGEGDGDDTAFLVSGRLLQICTDLVAHSGQEVLGDFFKVLFFRGFHKPGGQGLRVLQRLAALLALVYLSTANDAHAEGPHLDEAIRKLEALSGQDVGTPASAETRESLRLADPVGDDAGAEDYETEMRDKIASSSWAELLADFSGSWRDLLEDFIANPDFVSNMIMFQSHVWECRGQAIFQTSRGHVGVGPCGTRAGDDVCWVFGEPALPVLLRNLDDEYCAHVGACYVPGLLDDKPRIVDALGRLWFPPAAFSIR